MPAVQFPNRPDLLVVGGGLAGALVALAFARWRPDVSVELIDAAQNFGGNHIWSVFASDLDADGADLIEPLIAARWDGYDIAFPKRARTLRTGYASLTSDRLDAHLRATLGTRAQAGMAVSDVGMETVVLATGGQRAAGAVLDARGPVDAIAGIDVGWQKFVGQELRLAAPHGLVRPVVMDACVEQIDGYRFVYVLPLSADTLFIEDTYYSDTPTIDRDTLVARIADYADGHGWRLAGVEREERGALPVVIGGRFDAVWPAADPVARAGARAGLFHPTTGYSLPDAVRFAVDLARAWPMDGAALGRWSRARAAAAWQDRGFYRLLDTMLFRAATPEHRYRVLEHFYRLPDPLVERFYAGKTTVTDRMRVLSGRPPVPISAAVRSLLGR